jgi:LmbE family N-acetylglucosaminyl deacetylase
MKLFLSPHNDDETLFGAFTLLRERPLVVIITDSFIQEQRDARITWQRRRRETMDAMTHLGCSTVFLGLRDDLLRQVDIETALRNFSGFEEIYAPARQGGHPHHDMVHDAAQAVFRDGRTRPVTLYSTYSKFRFYANEGERAIVGNVAEWILKRSALACYPSQTASAKHFAAVQDQPEWLTP